MYVIGFVFACLVHQSGNRSLYPGPVESWIMLSLEPKLAMPTPAGVRARIFVTNVTATNAPHHLHCRFAH